MVRPSYPKDALRNGERGLVVARVLVSAEGKTENITIISGQAPFSESAVAAIHKWHFQPINQHGRPVETVYRVRVRFNPMLREADSDVELVSPQSDLPPVSIPPLTAGEDSGEKVYKVSEPGVVAPKEIYTPEPEFPEEARKKREPGIVNVALVVGVDGRPKDLRVACSSSPGFAAKAIESLKQWKFTPATRDGQAVPVQVLVEVSFKLD